MVSLGWLSLACSLKRGRGEFHSFTVMFRVSRVRVGVRVSVRFRVNLVLVIALATEPSRRFRYFAATEPSRVDGSAIHRLQNRQ